MTRFTVGRIASAIARRLGLSETPIAAAPITDPLWFDHRCVLMCEGNFESRTSIVTMNKSLRKAKTLELTVRSIINDPQLEPLIQELLAHLSATGSDDTYQQVYADSNDYLAARLQQPVDAGRKFLSLSSAMFVDPSMRTAELVSVPHTVGATA